MANIAIYGGSFNPPHFGHVYGVATVLGTPGVDQVWLMPCHTHAFAKSMAAFADRVVMCRAMLSMFASNQVDVTTIESELPAPNRTIDTLDALQEKHPEHQFRLVIGTDIFLQKDDWKDFDRLESMYPLIVLGRQGYASPPNIESSPPLPNVSSSDIRTRLQQDQSIDAMIPASVMTIIKDKELYR